MRKLVTQSEPPSKSVLPVSLPTPKASGAWIITFSPAKNTGGALRGEPVIRLLAAMLVVGATEATEATISLSIDGTTNIQRQTQTNQPTLIGQNAYCHMEHKLSQSRNRKIGTTTNNTHKSETISQ
jgi:hypothetical protein